MRNILLFFMSSYPKGNVKQVYYKYEDGGTVETASHTNMGTAKVLTSYLDGKLDKVIYLASEHVRAKDADGKTNEERFKTEFNDWYMEQLNAERWNGNCKIEFSSVEVPNEFPNKEIMNYAIEMMKEISANDHVFIDFAGGIRQAAFALVAVAQILRYKGVEVKLLSNQFNRENNYSEYRPLIISEDNSVASGVEYVGATQFFLRTGDITELKEWFEYNTKLTKDETTIVEEFGKFYARVSLCNVDGTLECWNNLREQIEEYQNKEDYERTKSFDNVMALFHNSLFTKDTDGAVGLIRWCVDHNLIQQALTIYNEKIPEVVGFKKNDLLYRWPCTEYKKEELRTYIKIYEVLKSAYDSGEITINQYNFKVGYLLLDSMRDHANHASSEEKSGAIHKLLEVLGYKSTITVLMADLEMVKSIITIELDNMEKYKNAF